MCIGLRSCKNWLMPKKKRAVEPLIIIIIIIIIIPSKQSLAVAFLLAILET
jgi:hypothetical protein